MNQQSSPLRQSFLSQVAMSGETTSNKLLSPDKSSSIARQSSVKYYSKNLWTDKF